MPKNFSNYPVFMLGFRLFFFLGAFWAMLSIVIWMFYLYSGTGVQFYLPTLLWHAHEMIFGFASAVIAGFILTASSNWTGMPGVSGLPLIILGSIWIAARILNLIPVDPNIFILLINNLFYPFLTYLLWPYLAKNEMKNNWIFLYIFVLLSILQLMLHLSLFDSGISFRSVYMGSIICLLALISIIAGRVLPFFKNRAIPHGKVVKNEVIERLSLWTFIPLFMNEIFSVSTWFYFISYSICFLIHLIRFCLWFPWQTLRIPILLVLYLGYCLFILGLMLKSIVVFGVVSNVVATHMLVIGGMSLIVLGMITRVALGHTGRFIKANLRVKLSYVMMILAILFRVIVPIFIHSHQKIFILIASFFWCASFLIYLREFTPILFSKRLDNKVG